MTVRVLRIVAGALVLAGCGSTPASTPPPPSSSPPTTIAPITVLGTLTLKGDSSTIISMDAPTTGGRCFGSGGYDNIYGGAKVAITDGAGATVALGTLDGGRLTVAGSYARGCAFSFAVGGIPHGKGFYKFKIGAHVMDMKESELANNLDLTLGS